MDDMLKMIEKEFGEELVANCDTVMDTDTNGFGGCQISVRCY